MALTYYEKKVIQRTMGVIDTLDLELVFISAGTKDGKRSVCAVFDPNTKDEEVSNLIAVLSKCFRKADVILGKGATRPHAPEIRYPIVYVVIKGANR